IRRARLLRRRLGRCRRGRPRAGRSLSPHRRRSDEGGHAQGHHDECSEPRHDFPSAGVPGPLGLMVARTRPLSIVDPSLIRDSKYWPLAATPLRQIVTGWSVHARWSLAAQLSWFVSRRRPSLDTTTTFPRSETSLLSWSISPSSPVTRHSRVGSVMRIVTF